MTYDDYYDYAVRLKKTLVQILEDFHIKEISLKFLVNYCYKNCAWDYSICSMENGVVEIYFSQKVQQISSNGYIISDIYGSMHTVSKLAQYEWPNCWKNKQRVK